MRSRSRFREKAVFQESEGLKPNLLFHERIQGKHESHSSKESWRTGGIGIGGVAAPAAQGK
jgi:hypothetical protein